MYEIPYWISGMTVPEIISHLADHNLDCEGPYPRGETMSQWECRPPSNADGVEREVTIVGQNPEQIRLVVATTAATARCHPRRRQPIFWSLWRPSPTRRQTPDRRGSGRGRTCPPEVS